MQYSPKLKKVMQEIRKIIKDNDIAGFVVLHNKDGFIEYLNEISPSYSCGFIDHKLQALRFRLKKDEVGAEKAKELAEATYNMVSNISKAISINAIAWFESYSYLKKHWHGEDFDGDITSHTQQNN